MSRIMKTMDGNAAAAHIAYAFTDVAAIYPITPSSTMAEHIDAWSAEGRKNVFGQTVTVKEMQSEAGAAGAVHGSLQAGSLTSTFTASQGLLLMVPNMYKIAGELLPGVFHVSARAIASHALSIFGDHQDVMAARATGFALLASGSVQEVMDLGSIAHLSAIKGRVPFVHFFDGFRTSHEIQKIEVIEYDELAELLDMDAVKAFRNRSVNPEHPFTRGTAQNPDIYFQEIEASNPYYLQIPDIVNDYMMKVSHLTGREYKPFVYYGDPEAENVIVAMGSVTQTIEETIDFLRTKGEKVGVVEVHLFRPFSAKYFLDVMPKTVKRIAVLDRTKEKGALAEPLFLDIKDIYYNSENQPLIIGGRYGLGSKDTTPSQINAVYKNLASANPKDGFTIGIIDDVTNLSLPIEETLVTEPLSTIKCKFWGFGSDGTVGANKSAIKIIGDGTDMYAQGYFDYDSKKSGGITISHLRFGKEPIKSTYLISEPDFISCSKQAYVDQYDLLRGIKKCGTFLLNTVWSPEDLETHLPSKLKRDIANNDVDFYIINATKIAVDLGLGGRTNMIMQSAFFKLSEVLPLDVATTKLKESIVQEYGTKGEEIVNMNYAAVDAGIDSMVKIEVPEAWKTIADKEVVKKEVPAFIENILEPMVRQEGNDLPVSTFVGMEDGTFPASTSAYEKRGIAVNVPEWVSENCIQCNRCSTVCPHAAIRPILLDSEEEANKPVEFETIQATGKGLEEYKYRMQVSTLDCTGCGNCEQVCPAKNKALEMKPLEEQVKKQGNNWDYAMSVKNYGDIIGNDNLKNTQFAQPLLQFSGACAGCGETAYVKLATQLFGDRMVIANATGCSSIWGGSAPSTPYCANQEGKGPSWANSLFEDNAEYGYGMAISINTNRKKLQKAMEDFIALDADKEINDLFTLWIDQKEDEKISKEVFVKLVPLFDKKFQDEKANIALKNVEDLKDFIIKKSIWIIGGDGWAYDIGFGGVDHVLASGENINILVLDTEVYSNTGGQSSKATPTAAVAQFAAAGKRIRKKDLGMIAATYGYVYVAQIALGADMNQALKAIKEAESYNGPSLIIAYAPCINHGIRSGMGTTVHQEKLAVDAGYWHLYRFDPRKSDEGKNPFTLDSKKPTGSFMDFILSEVRYSSLKQKFPEIAEELFKKAEKDSIARYESYVRMARD
ncbi:MAG: pyruvate:ferredoxin (flavodoxin) oxidoreductase [Tissierellia bacterium]|nr:pyruvate:ferredoxin (flavodoxin) oxidoreductase [Tissierellia bacterium]